MSPEFQELTEGAPLREVFDFAEGLTRERNNNYLPTVVHRLFHFTRGIGEIAKAVRVHDTKILPLVSAKMLLRIFGVLDELNGVDAFIEALTLKYPESGCMYCGHKPCQCETDRPDEVVSARSSEAQRTWSVSEWQKHLGGVYGARNDRLTLPEIILRLPEELGETAEAALLLGQDSGHLEENKMKIINELADCFAWLIAVCNYRDVAGDLEAAFVKRYGKGCPNCGNYPCKCETFSYIDDRKDERVKALTA
jgi:NTP pyrophosphatase (non-canonical NTP hydrolase)